MVKVRFGNFMVHFNTEERTICFGVYPVLDWTGINDSGTSYVVKGTGCDLLEEFVADKAEKMFEGSLCWRGVWEGRIYFSDDEYWGEELKKMSDLYENHIVPWCKEFIKKREPHNYYED